MRRNRVRAEGHGALAVDPAPVRPLFGNWAGFGLGLACCVGISIPALGSTPDSEKLSLARAVDTALKNHPSLTRLEEESLAAEAQEDVANSAYFPRITLEALGKEGPPGAPGFGFQGLDNSVIVQNVGASVVLTQMIYDFGRALHRVQANQRTTAAAEARTQTQRALVTLEVYRVYYRALLSQHLVRLVRENLAARTTILRQAEARARAGLASRVDEGLERASLAEVQAGLVNAENEAQAAVAELNNAMGVAATPAYVLEEPPDPFAGSDKIA